MQGLLQSLEVPTPQPLDQGPLWMRMLLESPWYAGAILAVLAVVMYVVLNRLGKFATGVKIAGALVLLAAGFIVTATMVETQREKLKAVAMQLVGAVAAGNGSGVAGLLSDDAQLVYHLSPEGLGKAEIVALVESRFSSDLRVKDWSVLESQATLDGPAAGRVQIKVRVVGAEWNVPNVSWWRIDLGRRGESWVVKGISPIAVAGVREAR